MKNLLAKALEKYYNRYDINDKTFLDLCEVDSIESMRPFDYALDAGLLPIDGYVVKDEYAKSFEDNGREIVFGAKDIDNNYDVYEAIAGRVYKIDNLWY